MSGFMDPVQRRDRFIRLCSRLCGVRVGDANNLVDFVKQEMTVDALDALLAEFERQFAANELECASKMLEHEEYGPACRSIMKLRLLGVWYDPRDPTAQPQQPSGEAFASALCWKIMQAHAPAVAGPMDGPAYWSTKPDDLEQCLPLLGDKEAL